MTPLWLSRARLRNDAGMAALGQVLLLAGDGMRAEIAHRLVWTLFADHDDRVRDFLYREEHPGEFLILSTRAPDPASALFAVEPKPFAPALELGDRLQFRLRVNPTVARGDAGERTRRSDIVMDALKSVPTRERAAARPGLVQREGAAWMHRMGERYGFVLEAALVGGYGQRCIPRPNGRPIRLGTMNLDGVLTVTNPATFLARLPLGFGRGRAFGCGLMLIRRT